MKTSVLIKNHNADGRRPAWVAVVRDERGIRTVTLGTDKLICALARAEYLYPNAKTEVRR